MKRSGGLYIPLRSLNTIILSSSLFVTFWNGVFHLIVRLTATEPSSPTGEMPHFNPITDDSKIAVPKWKQHWKDVYPTNSGFLLNRNSWRQRQGRPRSLPVESLGRQVTFTRYYPPKLTASTFLLRDEWPRAWRFWWNAASSERNCGCCSFWLLLPGSFRSVKEATQIWRTTSGCGSCKALLLSMKTARPLFCLLFTSHWCLDPDTTRDLHYENFSKCWHSIACKKDATSHVSVPLRL
jgi:hypothetical protein